MRSRELRACGRHGHVLYAPTERELADRIRASTVVGEAWRCLRCGDFTPQKPTMTGPANDAPVPARGKALRQAVILRVLAIERVIRGVVLVAAAYGIHRFANAQTSLRRAFSNALPAARPLADRLGVDIDRSWWAREATRALHARHSTLTWLAVGVAAYALVELVEGIGLWLLRRWAEYLTVVATAVFLPIEVHDLFKGVTVTRLVTFGINVAAVVYLVIAKRLFGVRGGRASYEKELAGQSLLELEWAAAYPGDAKHAATGSDVGMGTPHQ